MGQNEVGSDSGARKCVDVLQKTTFPKNRESENGSDFAQNCKGEAKSSPTIGSPGDGNIYLEGAMMEGSLFGLVWASFETMFRCFCGAAFIRGALGLLVPCWTLTGPRFTKCPVIGTRPR